MYINVNTLFKQNGKVSSFNMSVQKDYLYFLSTDLEKDTKNIEKFFNGLINMIKLDSNNGSYILRRLEG